MRKDEYIPPEDIDKKMSAGKKSRMEIDEILGGKNKWQELSE